MKIKWEVEDGYCGKSRPQTTTIDDEEFEDCETVEDVDVIINDAIYSDFEQLGYSITDESEKQEMLEKLGLDK